MQKVMLVAACICALWAGRSLAQAPHTIDGIVLGGNIETVRGRLDMETALPERYRPYLKEVEIEPSPGFKSGLLTYGTCADPGVIVRIRFKYADSSKSFFEKLLERFKDRFGEPDEWRGDPFGVLIAWKWSFTDDEQNRISMILQHNLKDADEKRGNAVKLTMWNLVEREQSCHERQHPEQAEAADEGKGGRRKGEIDWSRLVPR